MQKTKKTRETEREKTLLSEKRSVLKKSLTGPTLLEMSGYAGGPGGGRFIFT
jgi:hypothetical protein